MRLPSAPTAEPDRLQLLDAVRGFALFGVLLVNLRSFSLYGFLPEAARAELPTAAFDRLLAGFTALLVDGTSITLFSILFGVGFAMQTARTVGRPDRVDLYVRRMLVLLAIGMVHAWLFWWGDILRYYALLGLLLIPFARLPAATLAVLGVFVVVALPVVLQPVVPPLLPVQISAAESAAMALAAFSSDQWSVVLEGNLARDLRMRIAVWILPAYVFGRLLIGAAMGRGGYLQNPSDHLHFWKRMCAATLLLSVVLTVITRLYDQGELKSLLPWLQHDMARPLMRMLRNGMPLSLAMFYLSAFVLVFNSRPGRRRLAWLAPIGRMALSNYLAQTLVAIALFYGVGLGIGPRFGLVGVSIAAGAIFLVQAAVSAWWLARFRFGPMEWLWRSLSYGRAQPMRRDPRPA